MWTLVLYKDETLRRVGLFKIVFKTITHVNRMILVKEYYMQHTKITLLSSLHFNIFSKSNSSVILDRKLRFIKYLAYLFICITQSSYKMIFHSYLYTNLDCYNHKISVVAIVRLHRLSVLLEFRATTLYSIHVDSVLILFSMLREDNSYQLILSHISHGIFFIRFFYWTVSNFLEQQDTWIELTTAREPDIF